jgi:hypothetical protein
LLAGVLVAKADAEHDAHGGDAGEGGDEGGEVVGGDFSDAREDVADNQVQESPEDVDGGRGESFAGRLGKRKLARNIPAKKQAM